MQPSSGIAFITSPKPVSSSMFDWRSCENRDQESVAERRPFA